jgi:hypothetical protein
MFPEGRDKAFHHEGRPFDHEEGPFHENQAISVEGRHELQ